MNEQDVIEVLSEESARLTLRAVEKADQAAVLEQKGGPVGEVSVLRAAALVDVEAARRIRGLMASRAPAVGRRGGPAKGRKAQTATPMYGASPAVVGNGVGAVSYSTTA